MKKHIIINVGRQLGSGGRIIGNRIAEDFNIKFYDKELLDLAAKESGFNKKFFERNDEHKGFLKVLFSSFAPIFGNSDPYANQLSDESLFKFQSDAIRKAAEQDSCVFVGRCADYILRDFNEFKGHRGSAIHGIFITAGSAETTVTTEGNKLEISAVDHLIDIFHLSRSGMKSIFDFFIMICKDLL